MGNRLRERALRALPDKIATAVYVAIDRGAACDTDIMYPIINMRGKRTRVRIAIGWRGAIDREVRDVLLHVGFTPKPTHKLHGRVILSHAFGTNLFTESDLHRRARTVIRFHHAS